MLPSASAKSNNCLIPETPPPLTSHSAHWRAHPRLQRHLTSLSQRDAASVLRRYHRKATLLDHDALLRHTCHVAAWVALLPWEVGGSQAWDGGLSPASLLAYYLKLCGAAPLTPWLRGTLKLVAHHFKNTAEMPRSGHCSRKTKQMQKHWSRLRRHMPADLMRAEGLIADAPESCAPAAKPCVARQALPEPVAPRERGVSLVPVTGVVQVAHRQALERRDAVEATSHWPLFSSLHASGGTAIADKRQRNLQILHRFSARWSGYDAESKGMMLDSLEKKLRIAEANMDWRGLLFVFRQAAASLTAPRRQSSRGDDTLMAEDIPSSLEVCVLQTRLRDVFFEAWQALQGFETDDRVECIVDYVKNLISHFEHDCGDISLAAAGSQWVKLKAVLASSASAGAHPERTSAPTLQVRCGEETVSMRKLPGRRGVTDRTQGIGVYTPNARLKALKHVSKKQVSVTLRCNRCADVISSSWFVAHKGKERLLMPRRHRQRACGGQYQPDVRQPCVGDIIGDIDVCHHGILRKACHSCSTRKRCAHGQVPNYCRQCRRG